MQLLSNYLSKKVFIFSIIFIAFANPSLFGMEEQSNIEQLIENVRVARQEDENMHETMRKETIRVFEERSTQGYRVSYIYKAPQAEEKLRETMVELIKTQQWQTFLRCTQFLGARSVIDRIHNGIGCFAQLDLATRNDVMLIISCSK